MPKDQSLEDRTAKVIDDLQRRMTRIARQDDATHDLIRQTQELIRRSQDLSRRAESTIGTTKRIMGVDRDEGTVQRE